MSWLPLCGVAVVLVCLLIALDHEAARLWPQRHTLEREVTASSTMLSMLSLGMRPLIADYLWIDAVQYFGHTLGSHHHDVVDGAIVERGLVGDDVHIAARVFAKLIRRIMDVDPGFVRPPLLGALFLIDPHADPLLGLGTLEAASRANPSSWQIRLWHGFYRYAILRDKEGARRELVAAERAPGRPDYVGDVRLLLDTAPDSVLAKVFFTRARQEARTETERQIFQQRLDEVEAGMGFGLDHEDDHEHPQGDASARHEHGHGT